MTKMLFKVSKLTFIQKQSIVLDYSIEIRNLREKDKIFLAGALGNYSLAGFEMVVNPLFIQAKNVSGSDSKLGVLNSLKTCNPFILVDFDS